jgi:hypothetical protein
MNLRGQGIQSNKDAQNEVIKWSCTQDAIFLRRAWQIDFMAMTDVNRPGVRAEK